MSLPQCKGIGIGPILPSYSGNVENLCIQGLDLWLSCAADGQTYVHCIVYLYIGVTAATRPRVEPQSEANQGETLPENGGANCTRHLWKTVNCLLRHVWDLSAQLHYGQAQLAAGDLHHSSTVAVRVGNISNPATFAGHARRGAPEIERNLVLLGNADALILQHGTVREQVPGGCFGLTALALRMDAGHPVAPATCPAPRHMRRKVWSTSLRDCFQRFHTGWDWACRSTSCTCSESRRSKPAQ